jgi:hypothetical protein
MGAPLLQNVLITTERSTFTASSGVTSQANSLVLAGYPAFIGPNTETAYKVLPEQVLASEFIVKVESGTDIVEGDIFSSITLRDGVTPWPGLNLAENSNETLRVTFAKESTPGPLAHRIVYVGRERGGGPVY